MNDATTLAVAGAAAVVASIAAWLHHPRPPELDTERWFKIWLATLLRGRVEADGGDADAWVLAVRRFVPYHPAGREPERKVTDPTSWRPPDGWLEGERGLVEALAALPGPAARWAWLYDQDERGLEARLEDPATLGVAYDPATWLGAGRSWDAVARGGLVEALVQRLGARWVLVDGRQGGAPPLLDALARALPTVDRIPHGEGAPADTMAAVLERLVALAQDPTVPLVVVAADVGVCRLLRALVESPGLRDRVAAVVSVGGVLGGLPGDDGPLGVSASEDWMGRWFGHDTLDTDALVPTPYLALQWWSPDGPVGGVPLAAARWPALRAPSGVPASVQALDLGPLPADPELPLELVAEALVGVTVCAVIAARG